ncbi:MAG TPA: PAS domain S-box protein [Bryobacteraceae bacterium]|nr:PAS domain S-box protein [Bryobacteraceae bacterium]
MVPDVHKTGCAMTPVQISPWAESIAETVHDSLLILNERFQVLLANRAYYQTFLARPAETVGRSLFTLGKRQWNIPDLRGLLERARASNTPFHGFAVHREFPGIGLRRMLLNGRALRSADGARVILLAIEDASERERPAAVLRALLHSAAQGILAVDSAGRIVLANRMAEKMFGYPSGGLTGRNLGILIPAASRDRHRRHYEAFFAAPRSRRMGSGQELAGRRKDGIEFPVEVSLSSIETPQGRLGVAFISDITERRHMEEVVREQRAQLDKLLATAPGAICAFRLRPDGTASLPYASPGFYRIVPGAPDMSEDATPLFAMMPPEDAKRIEASVAESARTMKPWHDHYRLHTKKRGTIWVEGQSVPSREPDGSIYWYGFLTDITGRKKLEAEAEQYRHELRVLSSRLLTAQEDQSKFLARELHDVFSQQLAVIAMDVSALRQQLPPELAAPGNSFGEELNKVGVGIQSLAEGLHRMSRQIHPSILADLGLVAALKNECQTFSKVHAIPVHFRASRVPRHLPEKVALTIYRVAQETLRNIGKHAAASEVRFQLSASESGVRLFVEDVGDGFELAKMRKRPGLGLISMEERVRMVNGVFRIDSHPGKGTRVEVRVPLPAGNGTADNPSGG